MSEWTITRKNNQIELRKLFKREANLLIIVCPGGWTYKEENPKEKLGYRATSGFDIRMSTNGVMKLTVNDWKDINEQVNKALEELKWKNKS